MSFPAHVKSSLPKWKFWTRMNRTLTDTSGAPIAHMKKSWALSASLLDLSGEPLVKAKLQIGVKADLYDAKDKIIGSVKLLRIQPRKLFPDVRELWGIAKNSDPYIFLWPVEKHKVAHDVSDVSIAQADALAYQIVKGDNVIAILVTATGGFYENFDLLFEKGTSEEDRLLCTMLMGYKMHNLLK